MRPRALRTWFRRFQTGDPVIYRMRKASIHPGPRAQDVQPSLRGESYAYVIEKHWRVADVDDEGLLSLVTRRGKVHVTHAADRNLRHPSLWERWRLRHRFPAVSEVSLSDAMADHSPGNGRRTPHAGQTG